MYNSVELPVVVQVMLDEIERVESVEWVASPPRSLRLHSLVVPMFEAVECMRLELCKQLIGEQRVLRHAHHVWQIADPEYTHLRRGSAEIHIK